MSDATIAVITYKRPIWLARCLEALIRQKIKKGTLIDILVIDNACDEQTKKAVGLIAEKSTFKIKYEIEKRRGIVAARNKCVDSFLESGAKNLVFIDDDEWPSDSNWIQSLLDKKDVYSADIVTSHVLSVGENGAPDWAVKLIYGKNKYREGDLLGKFYTNNLLLSRRVLESVRPAFDSRFAMTGASDYHFALKCSKVGFRAVYINAPVFEEFPSSRANIKWFVKRGFRSGVGFTRSHIFEENVFIAIIKSLVLSSIRLLRGLVAIVKGCLLFSKMNIVSGLFRISSAVGTLAGFFGIKYCEYKNIHGR